MSDSKSQESSRNFESSRHGARQHPNGTASGPGRSDQESQPSDQEPQAGEDVDLTSAPVMFVSAEIRCWDGHSPLSRIPPDGDSPVYFLTRAEKEEQQQTEPDGESASGK